MSDMNKILHDFRKRHKMSSWKSERFLSDPSGLNGHPNRAPLALKLFGTGRAANLHHPKRGRAESAQGVEMSGCKWICAELNQDLFGCLKAERRVCECVRIFPWIWLETGAPVPLPSGGGDEAEGHGEGRGGPVPTAEIQRS